VAATPEVTAPLAPPLSQALGRVLAARACLCQATTPRPMSAIRRVFWANRAEAELAAAEDILRKAAPYPIVEGAVVATV
jgi:hypothetical protein